MSTALIDYSDIVSAIEQGTLDHFFCHILYMKNNQTTRTIYCTRNENWISQYFVDHFSFTDKEAFSKKVMVWDVEQREFRLLNTTNILALTASEKVPNISDI
jgi:hypothetical protein